MPPVLSNLRNSLRAGQIIFLMLSLLAICFLPACSPKGPDGCYLVEIAPEKFVPVKYSKWSPRQLIVRYGDTKVKYPGYITYNAPQTLMEFEGKLYLLALEAKREAGRNEWPYRCFRQEGSTFKEIPAKEFPRSVAIFNLWRPGVPGRYAMGMTSEDKLDYAKLGRELNPEDIYFVNSYQAMLWYMLEVTNSLGQAESNFYGEEARKFVQEYIAKYKPVRLSSMEMKPVPKKECKF